MTSKIQSPRSNSSFGGRKAPRAGQASFFEGRLPASLLSSTAGSSTTNQRQAFSSVFKSDRSTLTRGPSEGNSRNARTDGILTFKPSRLFYRQLSLEKGVPLDPNIRSKVEFFFKADFSAVRIHVGVAAKMIGAVAFTMGNHIYWALGHYQPYTRSGLRLLGHELTHVLQQRLEWVRNPSGSTIAVTQDPVLEEEANQLGEWLASGEAFPAASIREIDTPLMRLIERRSSRFLVPSKKFTWGTRAPNDRGAVIQRKTISEYLQGVKDTASLAGLWCPDFDRWVALLPPNVLATNYGVTDLDALTHLMGLSIQHGKAYKKVTDIILYTQGKKSAPAGAASLKDLRIDKDGNVLGRPGFSPYTKDFIMTNPTQHRRHIIAWHTQRSFFSALYKAGPKELAELLELAFDDAYQGVVEEAEELVSDVPEATFGKAEHRQYGRILLKALFIMNSNVNNLWAGVGQENSEINTASHTVAKAIEHREMISDLLSLAREWVVGTENTITSIAKRVSAQIIISNVWQMAWVRDNAIPVQEPHEEADFQKIGEELENIFITQFPIDNQDAHLVSSLRTYIYETINYTLETDLVAESKTLTAVHFQQEELVSVAQKMFAIAQDIQPVSILDTDDLVKIIQVMMSYSYN